MYFVILLVSFKGELWFQVNVYQLKSVSPFELLARILFEVKISFNRQRANPTGA